MRTLHGCVAILSISVGLLAQKTDIVPKSMLGLEGGSKTSIPFGWSSPNRYMAVYEAGELPWSGPKLIKGLRFRADGNKGASMSAKQFLTLEMSMSTSTVDLSTVSQIFDDNHGNDVSRVFDKVPVSLPAQPQLPGSGVGPRPCNISFPFSEPWFYGLSPSKTADGEPSTLVLEIRTYQTVSGPYFMDNPTGCSSPTTTFGKQDPLCLTSLQKPLTLTSTTSVLAGGRIDYEVTNLEILFLALVVVGLSTKGTMFGFPLPVSLDKVAGLVNPNPRNPISAPDCYINVEPILALPVTIQGKLGTARLNLPNNRGLVGQSFFAQAVSNDLSANSFQYTASLGLKTTVCGPAGVTRLHNLSSATGATGNINTGSALIFEVY